MCPLVCRQPTLVTADRTALIILIRSLPADQRRKPNHTLETYSKSKQSGCELQ